MRLSILIGAGASYGCGYTDLSVRPPLGAELFDQLVKGYPETWGVLIEPDLVDLYKVNFEEGMAETHRRWPPRFSRLLIDMATYFLKFDLPIADDLYSALVRDLRDCRLLRCTGVASLNYECVFEIAVSQQGLEMCINEDTPLPRQLLLWKPHGWCNFLVEPALWGVEVACESQEAQICESPITWTQPADALAMYNKGFGIPPCMSLYTEGKANLVSRDFIETARAAWGTWARRSDYVISIGASPTLADTHVWEPILESKAFVWYVGGDDDKVAELTRRLGDRFRHVGRTFEEASPILSRRLRILA